MRLRNNTMNLSLGEADRLAQAFENLKFVRPFNYDYWASLHQACPHKSALFLPWHRAYIYEFETALQQASNGRRITLPYWDWVTDPKLPPIVTDPKSPLYRERYTDEQRATMNLQLPTAAQIAEVQATPTFTDYGGRGCVGAGQAGGVLEDRHGLVHFWVGPEMAEPRKAATDPVFWFHHANVDRLWAEWQRTHATDLPFECLEHDLPAIPGCYKGKEAMGINGCRFGYAYVDQRVLTTERTNLSPFDTRPVVVRIPQLAQRVYLVLENVTLTGSSESTAPTGLTIARERGPGEHVTQSLFGLMQMDKSPSEQPHDHDTGMHRLNLRVEVTPLLTPRGTQDPTRELVVWITNATPRTASIRIERILAEVSGY